MCTGLETIALVSSIAGTAFGVYGAYQQGQAQKQQYKYQQSVAQNNAEIARMNSEDAIKRGEIEVENQRRKVQHMMGDQRAGFAGANVMIDSGSPLDTIMDTWQMGELDALTIENNAQREARNYTLQAQNYDASASNFGNASKNAGTASYINAGSTLLSGAGSVADTWYRYNNPSPNTGRFNGETVYWNQPRGYR